MNNQNALGFVETAGLVTAITVADAMAKAAEVTIVCYHKVDGKNVCVICEGDVAACQAAVDAGCAVATANAGLLARNVIARPADGDFSVQELLGEINTKKAARKAAKKARRAAVAPEQEASQGAQNGQNDNKKPKK